MTASDEAGIEGQDAESLEELSVKLKNAREAQDLTLDEIAAELRIGINMLRALEESRFDELGVPVFAKGYLKQYGARLGLDVPELIADYERCVGDQSIEIAPSTTIRLRDERQITVWVIAAIVLALLAAVLWVWWWLGADQAIETVSDQAINQSAVPAEEIPVEQPLAPPEPVAEDSSTVEASPLPTGDLPNEAGALSDEISEIESVSELRADSAETEDIDAEAAPAETNQPTVNEPVLEILFVEDSWTDITSDSGDQLYYNLGRAGTRTRIPMNQRMNLFFGNAAGVRLTLNGEPYDIPPAARRGDLAQFDLEAVVD